MQTNTAKCSKCDGRGSYLHFGVCFQCNGQGYHTYDVTETEARRMPRADVIRIVKRHLDSLAADHHNDFPFDSSDLIFIAVAYAHAPTDVQERTLTALTRVGFTREYVDVMVPRLAEDEASYLQTGIRKGVANVRPGKR